MKKIILLFLLFSSIASFSQEQILVEFPYRSGNSYTAVSNSAGQVIYSTSGTQIVAGYSKIYNLSASDFPLTVVFNPPSGCGVNQSKTYTYQNYTNGINLSIGCAPDYLDIRTPYINVLTAATSTIGVCQNIALNAGTRHYYRTNIANSPIPFTSPFTTESLLGSNYKGPLYIKSDIDSNYGTPKVTMQSKEITYNVIPCPPALLSTSTPNYTTCSDSYGAVTFTFKRALDTANGEKFLFNYNIIGGPPFSAPSDGPNVEMISPTVYKLKNLSPGTYNFTYQTEFNDNTRSSQSGPTNFTITPKSALTANVTATQPLCNTDLGKITINASGDNPPYSYTLDGVAGTSTFSSSIVVNNVPAGTHSIVVSGSINTCPTVTLSGITITQPLAITIDGSSIDATGFGLNNGKIVGFIPSGGTPINATTPYTITWTKDGSPFTPINLNQLYAGVYVVKVTDRNGCEKSKTFIINQPQELKVSITGNSILCFGNNTGSLSVTSTTGGTVTLGYTYEWFKKDNTNAFVSINEYGTTVTGQTAGFYKLQAKDNANNTAWSNEFEMTQPVAAIAATTASKTDVKCYGEANGTITLNITGGTAGYTVLWSDSISNTHTIGTPDRTGLPTGSYSYTITDANGCTFDSTANILIDQPIVLSVSTSQTQPTNGLNNGLITANATGGTAPYSYIFKNGSTVLQNSGSNTITSLPNGTYQVTVIDVNSCSLTSSNINLEALSVSITQNNGIVCNSDSSGKLTAVASGGSLNTGASYTYQWYKNNVLLTNETNAVLSNLGIGTYKVEVKDSNIITPISAEITLTEPTEISITETLKTNVNCYGGNDGMISISVSGGTPTSGVYNFSLSGSGTVIITNTTTSITGLAAGNYTITIKDQYCTKIYPFSISQPLNPIVIPNPTITNVVIFGQNTGAITFAPITGGNGNYTYSWTKENDTAFISNSLDLSGLKVGKYTLTVKDSKANVSDNAGCIQTATFEITQQPELTVVIDEIQSIGCYGSNTGSLDVFIQGGVAPYKIDWYKLNVNTNLYELIVSNEIEINDLVAGTYKVIVTDAANPSGPYAITEDIHVLGQPELLTANLISKTDVLCFSNTTGEIKINVTGGTLPYTFQWKKNGVNYATNQNLTNLGNGDYTVLITDKNNCTTVLPTTTIDQPNAPVQIPTPLVTPLTGFGTQNGSIVVNITGGTAPYTYTWAQNGNPTFTQSTANITNLDAGFYSVMVTDANGCKAFLNNIEVTQPTKLEITAIVQQNFTDILCYGDQRAVLKATVIGGVPFVDVNGNKYYQYKWYNILSPTVTVATTNPTGALYAGTYTLLVTDAKNNAFTLQSQSITEPTKLSLTYSQTNVSCKNGNDGAIAIAITGGVAPYKIVWSTGANANLTSIMGLLASPIPYTVSVTDSNNCKITQAVTITEPDLFYLKKVIKTPPTTLGGNDGSIQVEVAGGTPNYNYYWYNDQKVLIYQNLDQASTTNIQNIYAGQYYLTVTDAKGCTIFEKDLDKIDPIAVTLSPININQCNGDNTASIKAIVTGGTPIYYYKWYNVNNTQTVINQNEIATGLVAGTYYVVVTDSFNMTITSTNIVVTEPTKIVNKFTTSYVQCGDGNDWTISTSTSGGTGNYSYLWNTLATTPNLQNASPGSYSVTITDQNGCKITENINITAPAHLDATAVVTPPVCHNGNDGRIEVTVLNGTAPFTYLWNSGITTAAIQNLAPGNYDITITDAKGCVIVKSYTLINPVRNTINIGSDITLCIGQSQTIDATIADANASYSWTSTKGFTSNLPIISVTVADTYTVVVTNGLGCQATDNIVVSNTNYVVEAQFAISSQAFVNEKIVIVDISKNEPESVVWTFPKEATIHTRNKDYAEISFTAAGEYEIGLTTTKGSCTAYQTKKIIVIKGEYPNNETDARKRFDINIYPNPSNGDFTANVKLDKKAGIHVKVFALNNNIVIDSKYEEGKEEYSFQFALNGLVQGIYFVLFESSEGNQLRKVIVY
jgi:SprB repeat/Secretion system C-terminal sorting domain